MGVEVSFVVQPFVRGRGGRLVPGKAIPERHEKGARATADRLSATAVGVIAVQHAYDRDIEGSTTSTVIVSYGDLPEGDLVS